LVQGPTVAGRFAAELVHAGQGFALASLTHVASGKRLLDGPLDLFEVEFDGHLVGSRQLAAEVVARAGLAPGNMVMLYGPRLRRRDRLFWTMVRRVCADWR
jgi:hypothetical protein